MPGLARVDVLYNPSNPSDRNALERLQENAPRLGVRLLPRPSQTEQEIEDALEQLEECDLGRDEKRSVERNLNELRAFVGATCSIEMAFDFQGRLYVYELVTEWFQTFMDLSELIMTASSSDSEDDDEDGSDSSFGGYYSKN